MIIYKDTKDITDAHLRKLYDAVGWISYTNRTSDLSEILEQSQIVYSAWSGETLVGLIRTVGDGLTIQYVQDFLVMPEFQKQGIGKELFTYVLKNSEHIRQFVLMTDNSDDNQEIIKIYEKLGLKRFSDTGVCGLWRMK